MRAIARRFFGLPLAGLLGFALLNAAPLAAQPATFSDGGQLEITAEEGIEWQRDRQIYLARGNAVARRGDLTVRAQVLAAHYSRAADGQERITRVEAIGRVEIETPGERVTGDRAVYYIDEGSLRITGDDLRLETEEEEVTATESLEYYEQAEGGPLAVARGEAVLRRLPDGDRLEGDVVTARFDPAVSGGPSRASLREVQVEGNVRVSSDNVFATGERGMYYVEDERALLDGNVRVTRGETQLNGGRAEVDMRTGVSRLLAGDQGPVRGLLSRDDMPAGSGPASGSGPGGGSE